MLQHSRIRQFAPNKPFGISIHIYSFETGKPAGQKTNRKRHLE